MFSSSYFIGFSLGVIFFPLPDKLGRKMTMKILMPAFLGASFLSIFGQSLMVKGIGMMVQGFLHLKIMLAYTHIFELTDEKSKGFCATFINSLDGFTFTIEGLAFLYVTKNGVSFMYFTYLFGAILIFTYLIVIPESPRWLFKAGRKSEGIASLNLIAWYNGSIHRFSEDDEIDLVD